MKKCILSLFHQSCKATKDAVMCEQLLPIVCKPLDKYVRLARSHFPCFLRKFCNDVDNAVKVNKGKSFKTMSCKTTTMLDYCVSIYTSVQGCFTYHFVTKKCLYS